jgi:hypothetical protein
MDGKISSYKQKIQNRKESRVGPSRNRFEEAKGRESTEKERGGE